MIRKIFTGAVLLFLILIPWNTGTMGRESSCFDYRELENLEFISDPAISPDGEMVSYVLSSFPESASGQDRMNRDIWMAFPDGRKKPFAFAFGPDLEFTPDGLGPATGWPFYQTGRGTPRSTG
jgi:hypothetical protein